MKIPVKPPIKNDPSVLAEHFGSLIPNGNDILWSKKAVEMINALLLAPHLENILKEQKELKEVHTTPMQNQRKIL